MSISSQVLFRGLLLHALLTKARMGPRLAALLSALLFGLAHVGNEGSWLHKALYAGWTTVGGLIFGAAYTGTHGGLLLPIALHFGLNSIIFAHSAGLVAKDLLHQRRAASEIALRLHARERASRGSPPPRDAQAAARAAGADAAAGATTAAAAGAALLRARLPLLRPLRDNGELFLVVPNA